MSDKPIKPVAVHLDHLNTFRVPMPDPPARSAYERIKTMIREFEAELDSNHEVGMCVVGGPGNQSVHVTAIGYWGPDIIRFFGTFADGRPIEIIQNVAQINVMLMAVPKMGEEPIRLGDMDAEDED